MKFPFEFSTKTIFRLLFPGAILAAAMAPIVHAVMHALGIRIRIQYAFPFEAIAWGWLIVICGMPIYMLMEGRRFWPLWLHDWMLRRQGKRLERLTALIDRPKLDESRSAVRRRREAELEYALYPTNQSGDSYVEHPTRVGNIIESYESYPDRKYGLDAIFYWDRLWLALDKDLREEIDNAQSVVDSTVYIVFVLYLSGLIMFAYAGLSLLGASGLHWLPAIQLPYVPRPLVLCLLGAASIVIGFVVYRISLLAHAQFGERFKSVFDQFRSKLMFEDVLEEVGQISGQSYLALPQRTKNKVVWRYLRWHLIRDENTGKNYKIKDWPHATQ